MKYDLYLLFIMLIIFVTVSGCVTHNTSYKLSNSTFNIPDDFQPGNATYNNDTVNYISMPFKLNGEMDLEVVQYPDKEEYVKGINNPIYFPVTKNYTKTLEGTSVTVLEREDKNENIIFSEEDNAVNYYFVKSGKYYSIAATGIGSKTSFMRSKIEGAMDTIVETMK